jgi:peptidoglycan hydrolase CwlO-like protein
MNFGIKKLAFLLLAIVLLLLSKGIVHSQTDTPTPTPDNSALQTEIQQYEQKISDLQGQENTLSSQIAILDNQIKLTQYQIEATQEQITSVTLDIDTATKKISSLQNTLQTSITVLINRIVATYEVGTIQPIQILLTSNTASDFFTRLNYLKLAQAHDKQLIYDTQQAKTDYSNQKNIFVDKKAQLESLQQQLQAQTNQLNQENQAKQDLLTQTQGSEATYQSLLAQAQAQLAGFASFVDSQGASLLSGQTYCDSWGCYYNQRDSQWGALLIDGRSDCNGPCSIARVGCLVTSVSMIVSYLGHRDILPSDIAVSDPGNFSVGTASLNKGTISVKGVSISRNTIASSLDPSLVQNGPVIVGIVYGPFGTHFVVIKSYTNGNYIMDDPYIAGGHDISFTDHYSLGSVFEVDRVSM